MKKKMINWLFDTTLIIQHNPNYQDFRVEPNRAYMSEYELRDSRTIILYNPTVEDLNKIKLIGSDKIVKYVKDSLERTVRTYSISNTDIKLMDVEEGAVVVFSFKRQYRYGWLKFFLEEDEHFRLPVYLN